jgi:small subunit ribosomal protein S4e
MPKSWPIARKGTKYVVRPSFGLNTGIPLLIVLRDMLKIAKNRKEVKKAIHEKKISINNKLSRDEKESVQLFDKVSLVFSKKYYKMNLSDKGKFILEEIKEEDANQKIAKIINKKILKGKKIQINLSDGRNFISDIKCKVNDSVSIDFKNKKIKKCLPLEKSAKIVVVAGKHAGKRGSLIELKTERKMAELKINNKKMNILIKHIIVTE